MPPQRRQEPPTDPRLYGDYKSRHGVIDKDPEWLVRTFQRRRGVAFALFGVTVAGFVLPAFTRTVSLTLLLVSLPPAAIAVHLYRCPQCGQQPLDRSGFWRMMPGEWGPDLNPRKCDMCGARLK